MEKVFIYKCPTYNEKDVNSVMEQLFASFSELQNIRKGTKMVIKANLVSAMDPEKAATTHYMLLKSLTTYLLAKDCQVVIGDSPGGLFTKTYLNHIYKATKMDLTGAKLNDNFKTKKGLYTKKVNL